MISVIREFNTGARYTEEGQVIRWRVVGEATQFLDCSRGIWGTIAMVCHSDSQVLGEYRSGNYVQGSSDIFQALRRS